MGSVNEVWAIWLEGSSDDIELLRSDALSDRLLMKTRFWKPTNLRDVDSIDWIHRYLETGRMRPLDPTMSPLMSTAANFYHYFIISNLATHFTEFIRNPSILKKLILIIPGVLKWSRDTLALLTTTEPM